MSNGYAKKVDANQQRCIDEVRAALPEATIQVLSGVGQGVPDLLIGYQGANYLVELKDGDKPPSRRQLNEVQVQWHDRWQGQAAVATSSAGIVAAILRARAGSHLTTAKGKEGA